MSFQIALTIADDFEKNAFFSELLKGTASSAGVYVQGATVKPIGDGTGGTAAGAADLLGGGSNSGQPATSVARSFYEDFSTGTSIEPRLELAAERKSIEGRGSQRAAVVGTQASRGKTLMCCLSAAATAAQPVNSRPPRTGALFAIPRPTPARIGGPRVATAGREGVGAVRGPGPRQATSSEQRAAAHVYACPRVPT